MKFIKVIDSLEAEYKKIFGKKEIDEGFADWADMALTKIEEGLREVLVNE